MSCFRQPKTLCTKITSKFSKFWWKNPSTGKNINWKAWDKMVKTKSEGGLGFRDLEGFNLALLGKQLWRLATREDSLLARVLKGKYYPNGSPLTAALGTKPSFGWRSIQGAQALMQMGMKKDFGNGSTLDMLKDPWLPTYPPRPPRPKPQFDTSSFHFSIFKENLSDQWNLHLVHTTFEPQEAKLICQVKPGGDNSSASYSWIHNNQGEYTVKSGYWLWQNRIKNSQESRSVLNPNLNPLYSTIWKSEAPLIIRHFRWRCISNSLAVGQNMRMKRLTKVSACPRCLDSEEDTNHMLFECPFARLVWALSPVGHLFFPEADASLFKNLSLLLLPKLEKPGDDQEKARYKHWPWILWHIWKRRNDLIFSGVESQANELLKKAQEAAEEWINLNRHNTHTPGQRQGLHPSTRKTWTPPDVSVFKCNIDGSWNPTKDSCGISWILRDHRGLVRLYGVKCFPRLTSPLETEATALVWAISCIARHGFSNVHFEMDCRDLRDALLNPSSWPRLLSFTSEILRWASEERSYKFLFAPRESNVCADVMAKHVSDCPIYFAFIDISVSLWLRPLVDKDKFCINNSN